MQNNLYIRPCDYRLTVNDLYKAVSLGLKALIVDSENAPMTFMIRRFQYGDTYVTYKDVVDPIRVMLFQYKWLGSNKKYCIKWERLAGKNSLGKPKFCDKKLLKEMITKVIPQAHLIIGQNSNRFDLPLLNDRLCKQNLPPIPFDKFVSLDILTTSRSSFKKPSHKLDDRAISLGIGQKDEMVMKDWEDVIDGKVSLQKKFVPYGLGDLDLTEGTLDREFSYYKKLPKAVEILIKSYLFPVNVCIFCKSSKKKSTDVIYTKDLKRAECNTCGSVLWQKN